MEIWHNPRCSKSRQALALLEEAGVQPDVRRYLDDPPTAAELDATLALLGMDPWDLVRRGEQEFADLGMADWDHDRQRWIEAMVATPRLIERPIVVDGDRAVVGRPPQNVTSLLDR